MKHTRTVGETKKTLDLVEKH